MDFIVFEFSLKIELFQLVVLVIASFAYATAHLAAPLIAAPAPVVTAQSSQVFARNYNGIAYAPALAHAPVPFVPAPVAPAFAPFPSRVVAPFLPPRVVAPFAHYAYPYQPFAAYPRPFYY